MVISTRDELIDAMGNNTSRLVIDKASISNAAAAQYHSLWRATGQPGQAAIPAAVAVCDNTLTGAVAFTQQTTPATSYLGYLQALCSNSAVTLEVHDRLVHMGGLSGTVTTAQNVLIDLSSLLATANLDARKGDANYSNVQWWVEWYTDTGATGVNITVNAKFNDGTNANLTAFALGATRRASYLLPLNGLIAAAQAGKYIRGINTITLSATTGTAGSFGITATRPRAQIDLPLANKGEQRDWAGLGLPEIPNSACLMLLELASTTTTGTVRGGGKILHG